MVYPKRLQNIITYFRELPGIGPRQAVRLAHALAKKESSYIKRFSNDLGLLAEEITHCTQCFRISERVDGTTLCDICRTPGRTRAIILVVEKDSDVETFESSGIFTGLYHVTGGVISALEKSQGEKLHLRTLFERVKALHDTENVEVIIATSNTLEGNQTATYIERVLDSLSTKVTRLGRGLSTGAEIEYADPLTLEAALKNRK